MKKVLLLGDSIRMGYDDYVKEELDGKCEVVYDAEDNGRFAAYTLWQANQMFKHHGHFDVVHWNNGYWDMNIEAPMTEAMHPVEEYVHFLKRIIKLCRENGAKIIFATTTPILEPGMAADNTGQNIILHTILTYFIIETIHYIDNTIFHNLIPPRYNNGRTFIFFVRSAVLRKTCLSLLFDLIGLPAINNTSFLCI